MYIKLFGYFLAIIALLVSLAMAISGGRWQALEKAAYGEKKRPWWFIALSILLIGLYILALVSFIGAEKNWAGWLLMVVIPLIWGLKGALLVFNPKGRQAVSGLEGDQNWRKVALARFPIAILLGILTYLA
jgi:heme/copper-type cytochrome/quinol oxidase subunit 2